MQDHPAVGTSTWPVARGPITRDTQDLLNVLARIDVEGWDSPIATALLGFVREHLIRPLAIDVGLRGAAASQAESTAWAAVWLKLCEPSLRSARSPWGVVWQTARRALLGEVLADRWGTNTRRAWDRHAEARSGTTTRLISLESLLEDDPAVTIWPAEPPPQTPVSVALGQAVAALVAAGWDREIADRIVAEVAVMEGALGHDSTVVGWRPLAAQLGLPPWQARRVTFVLRGCVDRPGLLARLISEGPTIVSSPDVRDSLAGTLTRTLPTPTQRPQPPVVRSRPQRIAS